MKERPILFSAPMVLALLAGTKTQTRRILKTPMRRGILDHSGWRPFDPNVEDDRVSMLPTNPYGEPGDRLWVKETFVCREKYDRYYYRADHPKYDPYAHNGWKPSIFMPRRASRLSLEITDVRVERLQDITEIDAQAEGIEAYVDDGVTYFGPLNKGHFDPRFAYRALWESINGAGSWDANPWVWALGLKRLP